jgi:hypothetical protein
MMSKKRISMNKVDEMTNTRTNRSDVDVYRKMCYSNQM